MKTNPLALILASKSPRRRELLEQAGLTFAVVPSCVDENGIDISEPEKLVKTLAEAKARDVANAYPESWEIRHLADFFARSEAGRYGRAREILPGSSFSLVISEVFLE